MYEARNKSITLLLRFIWVLTIPAGIIGRWSIFTTVLFLLLSIILTIVCMINMKRQKYGNICLGLCGQYSALLFLMLAYKLLYWQFAISAWYLVLGLVVFALIDALVLWKFIKNNKEIKKSKPVKSALSIGGFSFLIVVLIKNYLNRLDLDNQYGIYIVIMAGCSLVIATLFSFSIRHFALSDDRVLFRVETEAQSQESLSTSKT